MIAALLSALIAAQSQTPYPRDYPTAVQCASMFTVVGLARGETQRGTTMSRGTPFYELAAGLRPEISQEQFNADLVQAQNTLLLIVGGPNDPGFAANVEELAPELDRCEAMLRR